MQSLHWNKYTCYCENNVQSRQKATFLQLQKKCIAIKCIAKNVLQKNVMGDFPVQCLIDTETDLLPLHFLNFSSENYLNVVTEKWDFAINNHHTIVYDTYLTRSNCELFFHPPPPPAKLGEEKELSCVLIRLTNLGDYICEIYEQHNFCGKFKKVFEKADRGIRIFSVDSVEICANFIISVNI